jgi:hypothetical protein
MQALSTELLHLLFTDFGLLVFNIQNAPCCIQAGWLDLACGLEDRESYGENYSG